MPQGLPDDEPYSGQGEQEEKDEKQRYEEDFAAFANLICAKRKEAIDGRKESGIEDTWAAAEEAYHGIDDTNRHEFRGGLSGNVWTKPTAMSGSLTRDTDKKRPQSTGFVRLTSRYVDAGAAKVSEITIPVDGKAFSMKATPVPDAVAMKDDETPYAGPDGQPVMRAPTEAEMPQPGPDGTMPPPPEPKPLTVGDLARHQIEMAEESAEKAETRIHDWMVECQHPAQMRKVEFDMARLGVGVLKGPFPDERTAMAVSKGQGQMAIKVERKTQPADRWIDPWNAFPDPACGEDIHDGDYFFERDFMGYGKLGKLKQRRFYLPWAIDKVLEEGPDRVNKVESGNPRGAVTGKKNQFEIWYFHGSITIKELNLANPKEAERLKAKGAKDTDMVFSIVTMVNDTPIRVTLNPLEQSGRFPYRTASWRRRSGHWAGIGVAEQLSFPQKLLNAAVRAGMSNAAKSAGSIIGIDDTVLEWPNSTWTIVPDTIVRRNPDHTGPFDIRAAMSAFQVPNVTPQMLLWVELAFRIAEETTNIPLVTQGQSGKSTPDTFGGQQLQDSNAMQLLRDVGYSVCEGITNPLVTDYYEMLLLDPDVPDDEKSNMQVDANAGIALIEKALQDQAILMLHPLVSDPEFGFDKRKYAKTWIRIKRINPSDLMMSDEEYEARKKQPVPPPPEIAVAQINAKSRENIAASRDSLMAEKIRVDTDRDTAHVVSQERRDAAQHVQRMTELEQRTALAVMEHANRRQISLDDAKVDLAKLTMELRAQMELAGADGKGPQVATPKVEPEGRAPEGQAFQA